MSRDHDSRVKRDVNVASRGLSNRRGDDGEHRGSTRVKSVAYSWRCRTLKCARPRVHRMCWRKRGGHQRDARRDSQAFRRVARRRGALVL